MAYAVAATVPAVQRLLEAARADLGWYIRVVHRLEPAEHHRAWLQALQDDSIRRLLIIAPPKWAKTNVAGIFYPAWRIGRDPSRHFIYVSNTMRQADRQAMAIRDTVATSELYHDVFPNIALDNSKRTGSTEWYVQRPNVSDKDATLQATGIGGPVIGATCDELIIDDVFDQDNSATAYQRQKTIEWVLMSCLSRLTPRGRVVCINTRWHEEDLSGEFIKSGFTVLHTKALDESGESTWPGQWSTDSLMAIRAQMHERAFQLMYQGNTAAESGAVFRRDWWRYWKAADDIGKKLTIQSWDTAHKTGKANDYNVCTTWGVGANGFYLLDLWRQKCEYPELKRAFVSLYEKWRPDAVVVEDTSAGTPLLQEIRSSTTLPVVPFQPVGDKLARASAVSPLYESGRVLLPLEAAWRHVFEYEHEVFPGEHDDIVDSAVQALLYLRNRTGLVQLGAGKKESTWRRPS